MKLLVLFLSLFFTVGCAGARDLPRNVETGIYKVDSCKLYPRRRVSLDGADLYFSTPFRISECEAGNKPADIPNAVGMGLSPIFLQAGASALNEVCGQSLGTCDLGSFELWDSFDDAVYGIEVASGENVGEYFSMLSQSLVDYWGMYNKSNCVALDDSACDLSPEARVRYFIKLSVLDSAGVAVDRGVVLKAVAH